MCYIRCSGEGGYKMDGMLILGVLLAVLMYLLIILFVVSILVFSIILYRRISKKMSPIEKGVFGLLLTFINLFIITGTYFFIFKDMI